MAKVTQDRSDPHELDPGVCPAASIDATKCEAWMHAASSTHAPGRLDLRRVPDETARRVRDNPAKSPANPSGYIRAVFTKSNEDFGGGSPDYPVMVS